jgi:hypothetical protein
VFQIPELMEQMAWDSTTTSEITGFLKSEGLIDVTQPDLVFLTRPGIARAEALMKQPEPAARSVNVTAGGNVTVGGDVVGGDKITNYYGVQDAGLAGAVSRILEHLGKYDDAEVDRRFFEDHIEPMYKDLKVVVKDYQEVLSDVEDQLVSLAPVQSVIQILVERRQKYALMRAEIVKYADLLNTRRPAQVDRGTYSSERSFPSAVLRLITSEPATGEAQGGPTMLHQLIEAFEDMAQRKVPVQEYLWLVQQYSQNITQSWESIVDSYLRLRIECLR